MKRNSLLLFCIIICNILFAQPNIIETDTTTSAYKGLEEKKFYRIGYSSFTKNNITTYKINGENVDEATYDKYHVTWQNMENCKPCILLSYDYNDILIRKSIQYTDCPVGYWIEYFPNGKVKIIGHYKENETGDWDKLFGDGFCRKDGAWTYFNENGNKLYSELWKDNQFIRQYPEQTITQLWRVNISLNGARIDSQILTPLQVAAIKITPKYKNSSRNNSNITILFEITTTDHIIVKREFTPENFNTINVNQMLNEAEITSSETASCTMTIYNNGINVNTYWLKVKN